MTQTIPRRTLVGRYDIERDVGRGGTATVFLACDERAFEQQSHSMVFLRVDPQLAELRVAPAFQDLVRRMGL